MSNSSTQHPQSRLRLFAALVLLMAVAFSAPSYAQEEFATVWSINASNGRLSIADFTLRTTDVVNDDANQLTSPRAHAFRDDGGGDFQVLVADTLGGSVLIYAGGAGIAEVVLNETLSGVALRPDGIEGCSEQLSIAVVA